MSSIDHGARTIGTITIALALCSCTALASKSRDAELRIELLERRLSALEDWKRDVLERGEIVFVARDGVYRATLGPPK